MRTTLVIIMWFMIFIAGCTSNKVPLIIDAISPNDVTRGDRLRMTVQGVEDPSALTILANDQMVTPEVVYFNGDYWTVAFSAPAQLVVGENIITVVDNKRQAEIELEVHYSRLPVETPPFVAFIIPENRKVSSGEVVEITIGEDLTGKQVNVEVIELDGRYIDLSSVSTVNGDIIKFNMPPIEGVKVLLMVSVEGAEIFDYVEFFQE